MLIDNLKDINSTSDLFNYITNIESELEEVKKHRDKLLILNSSLMNKNMELERLLEETEHTLEFYQNKLTSKKETSDD
jgi:hypothetical protein